MVTHSKLDRKKLASIVFKNKKKLHLLNSIVHPVVNEHFINYCTGLNDKYIVLSYFIFYYLINYDFNIA